MTDHLVTLNVETETEDITYVQSPFRSVAFLAVFYVWELFEFTRIPNLLRRAGRIGPRMTAQQWMVKYPWLWAVTLRSPKGSRSKMTDSEFWFMTAQHNNLLRRSRGRF